MPPTRNGTKIWNNLLVNVVIAENIYIIFQLIKSQALRDLSELLLNYETREVKYQPINDQSANDHKIAG